MNLGDVYSNQVKKTRISGISSFSGSLPNIQKDPTIMRLEHDVFSKINEISEPESQSVQSIQPLVSVKTLSPEEAMKELLEIEKNFSQPK
jgi:hypothetical protein